LDAVARFSAADVLEKITTGNCTLVLPIVPREQFVPERDIGQ
jgi:hypothetical protein